MSSHEVDEYVGALKEAKRGTLEKLRPDDPRGRARRGTRDLPLYSGSSVTRPRLIDVRLTEVDRRSRA